MAVMPHVMPLCGNCKHAGKFREERLKKDMTEEEILEHFRLVLSAPEMVNRGEGWCRTHGRPVRAEEKCTEFAASKKAWDVADRSTGSFSGKRRCSCCDCPFDRVY